MPVDPYNVRVGFTRSGGVGDVIRAATSGDVNHALLIFADPVFNCALTLGANANGLTIERLDDLPAAHGTLVHIFAPRDSPSLVVGLRTHADWLNRPYDYAGLIGMAAVEAGRLLGQWRVHNPLLNPRALFCSEYVKLVLFASGYNVLDDVPPGSCDPQQLGDALAGDARFYEVAP